MPKQSFPVQLTYVEGLDVIDNLMKVHVAYLKKYYKLNHSLCLANRRLERLAW